MSGAHTPGPWHAERVEDRWGIYKSETPTQMALLVGWVEVSRPGFSTPTDAADAKLIAEAPAMFAAIGKLLSEGRSYSDETWYALKRIWQDAGGSL